MFWQMFTIPNKPISIYFFLTSLTSSCYTWCNKQKSNQKEEEEKSFVGKEAVEFLFCFFWRLRPASGVVASSNRSEFWLLIIFQVVYVTTTTFLSYFSVFVMWCDSTTNFTNVTTRQQLGWRLKVGQHPNFSARCKISKTSSPSSPRCQQQQKKDNVSVRKSRRGPSVLMTIHHGRRLFEASISMIGVDSSDQKLLLSFLSILFVWLYFKFTTCFIFFSTSFESWKNTTNRTK